MAKKPVQKFKTNRSKTRTRYASFARKKLNQLEGIISAARHTYKHAEMALKDEKQQKELDKINKVKV